MTVNWNYFSAREKHSTSFNFERGARKVTVQKKNKNRRTAHRDQRAQAQNASFSPLLTSTLANPLKINHFPPLATDTEARRTLKNAYLSMVSEGDRSPPVTAAVKKEASSGTHGRGVT